MNTTSFITFCQDIIRLQSLSGQEQDVAARIAQEMETLGYDEVSTDAYGNVIGKINGSGSRSLMFEGHMDTVGIPSPDAWSVDPFGAQIVDEKLYGRGTADMKCALAAMVYGAAEVIKENPETTLYVVGVVYEEIFEGVGFGKVLDQIPPDAVVLGESTELTISNGQKGRAEIVLESFGTNAHSATPERGNNAIYHMLPLIERIKALPVIESDELGPGILEVTDIVSSPYPGSSVIPDRCRATIDRRLLQTETEGSVLAPILQCIDELHADCPEFSASASYSVAEMQTYTGKPLGSKRFYPGWLLDPNHALVQSAQQALSNLHIEPRLTTYRFCTDGSESAGKRNIPTIGIGPSKTTMAHVVDEYVHVDELIKVAQIYAELARCF